MAFYNLPDAAAIEDMARDFVANNANMSPAYGQPEYMMNDGRLAWEWQAETITTQAQLFYDLWNNGATAKLSNLLDIDVLVDDAEDGTILLKSNGKWQVEDFKIKALLDVDLTDIHVNDHLKWDGSKLVPIHHTRGFEKTTFFGTTPKANSSTLVNNEFIHDLMGDETLDNIISEFSIIFCIKPNGGNKWEVGVSHQTSFRVETLFCEEDGKVLFQLDLNDVAKAYKGQEYQVTVIKHESGGAH